MVWMRIVETKLPDDVISLDERVDLILDSYKKRLFKIAVPSLAEIFNRTRLDFDNAFIVLFLCGRNMDSSSTCELFVLVCNRAFSERLFTLVSFQVGKGLGTWIMNWMFPGKHVTVVEATK